ncbi:MAG: T9SS type A sorting domain-containing protein [Crocinitomicaceae bacterium]|nr:T9SS type A sorting domain-containing protein [Crocinitomicaceae bacterium]
MKIKSILIITSILFSFSLLAQPSCSPSSVSPACASAIPLVVGGPCINGTTCNGGAQFASSCLYAGSECSWYSFIATATDMFVSIDVGATNGCHISSNVYDAASCMGISVPTEISCQSGTPLDDLHSLTGLTINNTYYVQVCYSPGGPCGNSGQADYCISVGEPDPPCDLCTTPCGTATGYPTNPTVATVVADCLTTPFIPELAASSTHTFCYNFIATATSVDFNVIITSNCGAGNVTGLTWDLYNNPACGSAIQSGTLAGLTFTGLAIGGNYVFCYTFTVPAACTHSQHCPFFVGATVPLPITLINFEANSINSGGVEVVWTTASELNNDYFTIERSLDGTNYEVVTIIDGAGTSSMMNTYKSFDRSPLEGVSYYRLKQTDFDGEFTYSNIDVVENKRVNNSIQLRPNPVNETGQLQFRSDQNGSAIITIVDVFGRTVLSEQREVNKGMNSVDIDMKTLIDGLYILSLENGETTSLLKFNKN